MPRAEFIGGVMEKLNVAELLKECPKGMELDCTICDNVYFDEVTPSTIRCYYKNDVYNTIHFHHDGTYLTAKNAKCVIFPKGKTTWEGFQRPFKDGDIITCTNSICSYVAIFKEMNTNATFRWYVSLILDDAQRLYTKENWADFKKPRLATEEEKQRLFDAIKANGYKWNAETKTLEKLFVPKFKIGDIIQDIDTYKVKITEVNIEDECYGYESMIAKGIGSISFSEQDNWKLVPNKFDITTLKAFESRVLVRTTNDDIWRPAIYGFADSDKYYVVGGIYWRQCIPYKSNEHLLGTTNDCDEYFKTWE